MVNGCVRDSHIDYKMHRLFIPANAFLTNNQGGYSNTTLSAGFNALPLIQINSSGIGGLEFSTTSTIATYLWQPNNFDNRHKLLIRYLWCMNNAFSGTSHATFSTSFSTFATGQRMYQPTLTSGLTTDNLTVAVPSYQGAGSATSLTAWTGQGMIAPLATGAFANQTFNEDPATEAVIFTVRLSTSTDGQLPMSSRAVYLIGMELAYTPNLTFGDGSRREARQTLNAISGLQAQIPDRNV